ncbi:MAG: uroporphyrinogen-III C-methyltransferase [Phycisphaeraceae bacterium]
MPEPEKKTAKSPPGAVTLVGAGPGDAGLITVAGLEALRNADVVVYDALANPRLLDEAPPHAELVNAGKRAKNHRLTQDQTNALMHDHAAAGRRVVRLKGGDPYLFGRGAEEASYLAARGVAVEVIPGITSGIAAPAAAGIPVTHREHASSVTFLTGHEDPTKPDSALEYDALAALVKRGGTLCIYMGVGRLPRISRTLIDAGCDPETPAAVVQWGTLPSQRSVRGTLADLPDEAEQAGIAAPAIVVVGRVAGIDEPGLDFFTRRALLGKRILVTRARTQASELTARLESLGADVLEAPTIDIHPPESWQAFDDAIRHLDRFDTLVLTSTNGVDALADRLHALRMDARHLAGLRVGVVGTATRERLAQRLAVRADVVPERQVGSALAQALIEQTASPGHALLLRTDIASSDLPDRLRDARWNVTEITAYRTLPASALPETVIEAIRDDSLDYVTFTSSSTANNLAALLQKAGLELPGSARVASIGPITSAALRELGWRIDTVAEPSDVPSLVDAIVADAGAPMPGDSPAV